MLPSLTIQEPLYWPAGKPKQTPPGRPIPDSEIHLLVQELGNRWWACHTPIVVTQKHRMSTHFDGRLWRRWKMMGVPSCIQLGWSEQPNLARPILHGIAENYEPNRIFARNANRLKPQ